MSGSPNPTSAWPGRKQLEIGAARVGVRAQAAHLGNDVGFAEDIGPTGEASAASGKRIVGESGIRACRMLDNNLYSRLAQRITMPRCDGDATLSGERLARNSNYSWQTASVYFFKAHNGQKICCALIPSLFQATKTRKCALRCSECIMRDRDRAWHPSS